MRWFLFPKTRHDLLQRNKGRTLFNLFGHIVKTEAGGVSSDAAATGFEAAADLCYYAPPQKLTKKLPILIRGSLA
jgi:hypothetical protein